MTSIESVDDFLKKISEVVHDFDALTSATFGEHSLHSDFIEVSLEHIKSINNIARTFFIRNGANKEAYYKLMKTSIWKGGKYMLFNYMFKNEKVFCPICNKEMAPYSSVLHHINYTNLFGIGNCTFVCSFQCHETLENLKKGS